VVEAVELHPTLLVVEVLVDKAVVEVVLDHLKVLQQLLVVLVELVVFSQDLLVNRLQMAMVELQHKIPAVAAVGLGLVQMELQQLVVLVDLVLSSLLILLDK